MQTVRVYDKVTNALFRGEILPREQPAVLKGLVADWPAVRAGEQSPRALADYIARLDAGLPVQTAVAPPEVQGRLFYKPDMSGFNFERINETFAAAMGRIFAALEQEAPPGIYAGAVSGDAFPGFAAENDTGLLDASVTPRLWASNQVTAPTHYDMSDNIAAVVAGRRRFTFFPPEQLPNLYVGPLEFTPAGQPTSLVPLAAPDLERFPRFSKALEAAQVAELEPGDAVYIPYMWWHNVESLSRFNLLVNYWWYNGSRGSVSAFPALVHAIMAIAELPPARRAHWQAMFQHYVFRPEGDPVPYLPPQQRGMLGTITPPMAQQLRDRLLKAVQRG
jgi:hypothetical protein